MAGRKVGDLSAALIGLIGARGPLSRAEAARLLKVSPARVTQATRTLVESGILTEIGTAPSDGGRPAILLDLTTDRRRALGVKITPNHLAFSRVDLAGNAEESTSVNLNTAAPDALERIVQVVGEEVRTGSGELLGIGLALPGSLDEADALVTSAVLGWHRVPLPDMLEHATALPVFVENDVNALAIAARLYDDSLAEDFALVTIGIGIGCAFTMGTRIYRGAHGGAGELGHILVDPDGARCACGLRGCLETLIGDNALTDRAVTAGILPSGGTKDQLNAAAAAGDQRALELFRWAGEQLGRTLASLVHVVDPSVLVVSGEGVDVWSFWEPGFSPALRAHLPRHRRDLRIVVREWGEDTWARGAAALVFASPFDRVGSSSSRSQVSSLLHEGA
ncbi:MAG: ROK family protein [Propionibacteriaceae bacterium]|nr:ROK family protein [Propionibacteriaceae bacterium]